MNSNSIFDWRWTAPLFGLLAAVGYTATNICLRSVTEVESPFVAFVRAIPTLLLVLPLLLLRVFRGQALVAPKSHIILLIITGVFTQIFGNVLFQWSLGIIGLALSVPLVFGSMIIGSALIGALVLKEPINKSTSGAIVLLLAAVTILTIGAQSEVRSLKLSEEQVGWVTLAVLGNLISGFAYSALGTVMRRGMKAGMSIEMTLLLLSLVGLTSLGTWSFWNYGFEYATTVTGREYAWMFGGGLLNAVSFYSLAIALKRLSVVYVHIINASQAAMAAAAGVMVFSEPLTGYLIFGIGLTAIGLLLPGAGAPTAADRTQATDPEGQDALQMAEENGIVTRPNSLSTAFHVEEISSMKS